jgi:hypothetical protein
LAHAGAAQKSRTNAQSHHVQHHRNLEILFGDAVLGVADQRDAHLAPGDEQVRVVVHLVRDRRQPVDEVDRSREVVEFELAAEAVAVLLPVIPQLAEPGLHVFIAQN